MTKHLFPITIVLNVYNAEDYIKECVNSILNQSFTDFELLLTLDGCTDNTENIISDYKDERITVIKNKTNKGVSNCLNKAISLAKGKYIVRMDGDDIMYPDRLKKQFSFMEKNLEIGVCSSWVQRFGSENDIIKHNYEDAKIKIDLLYGNPIAHPSVIMRSSLFEDKEIKYKTEFDGAEDYKLWTDLALITKFSNIPEVLLKYRTHEKQITNYQNKEESSNLLIKIKQEYFEKVFFKLAPNEFDAWNGLFNYNENSSFQNISKNLFFINHLRDNATVFFSDSSLNQIILQCEQEIIRSVYKFGDDLFNLKQENESLKREEISLLEKYKNLEQENENIKKGEVSFLQQYKSLEQENESLKKEEVSLLENFKNLEQENENLKKGEVSLLQQYKDLEQENENLKKEEVSLLENFKNLEQENENIKKEEVSLLEKYKNLEKENESLKKEEVSLLQQYKNLEKENESLKKEEVCLLEKCKQLEQEKDALLVKNHESEVKIKEISTANKFLIEKENSAKEVIKLMKNEEKERKRENIINNEKISTLIEKTNSQIDKIRSQEKLCEDQKSKLDDLLKQIKFTENVNEEKQNRLNELLTEKKVLIKENEVLRSTIVVFEENKAENKQNNEKITVLIEKTNNQIDKILIQEKLCAEQKNEIETLLSANKDLLNKLETQNKLNENKSIELEETNKKIEEQLGLIQSIKEDCDDLNSQLEKLNRESETRITQFTLLEKQSEKYRNKILHQENDIILLRDLVQKMRIKNRIKNVFKKND